LDKIPQRQIKVVLGVQAPARLTIVGLTVFQRRVQYFPDRRLVDPARGGMSGVERLLTERRWSLGMFRQRTGIRCSCIFTAMAALWSIAFARLRRAGTGFLLSYRGYGGSTGSPTQKGLMEDGETAFLEARARGYDGDRIVLMGESLGTGVAIALAATHEAAALVLDSPYSSAVELAAAHYAIFPVNWLMFDRYRSDLAIGDVRIPILVLHGDEDTVIPISLARRLFELANEPKTFMLVSGGKHLVLGLAEVFPRVRGGSTRRPASHVDTHEN
jgi:fermentation-respiration switch protein FrsA (DUF1100 family)